MASAIPKLGDLASKKVVIWGAGREGKACAETLLRVVPDINLLIVDDAGASASFDVELTAQGVSRRVHLAAQLFDYELIRDAALVVRSPGISRYDEAPQRMIADGVAMCNSTAFWMSQKEGRKVVGVTGSKGKSTTSSLLHHVLSGIGYSTKFGGNIGLPVVSWLAQPTPSAPTNVLSGFPAANPADYVVEFSSFQLADFDASPDIAVFTSLFEDHTDWHRTFDQYQSDKFNIFGHRPDSVAVLNDKFALLHKLATQMDLGNRCKEVVWFNSTDGFHARGREVWFKDRQVVPERSNPLLGVHNAGNIAAVFTVLDLLGLEPIKNSAAINEIVSTFVPLHHRLEVVSDLGGRSWVDDGLSTNPTASMAAIDAFVDSPITIFLGGFDRGVDYSELAEHLVSRRGDTTVLFLPDNGPRIMGEVFDALAKSGCGEEPGELSGHKSQRFTNKGGFRLELLLVDSLEAGVQIASTSSAVGEAIVLSPGAPSFGRFVNYEERSAEFVRYIQALASE